MKNLKETLYKKLLIKEKLIINKNTKINVYQPKDKDELQDIVNKLIKESGNEANLNDIDTSEITDMSKLFYASKFNGDISEWDVSNVTNMYKMFTRSKFTGENGDISKWNVSNVEKNFAMFRFSPLEKNPPKWYKSI